MTPINWNRYFMLPTVFVLVCVAVGATWLLRKITAHS
jgi:heme/copper-type cytochrome/quinol oxidase subunit 4